MAEMEYNSHKYEYRECGSSYMESAMLLRHIAGAPNEQTKHLDTAFHVFHEPP